MKTFIVDSFTDKPFKGNPAGVCFPEYNITDEQMLLIAQELGLSETAFVSKADIEHTYHIRYFSPKKEIPLCGHATLASAKVLFKSSGVNKIQFVTTENLVLPITRNGEDITMEFPVYNTSPVTVPGEMLNALGLGAGEITATVFSPRNKIIVIEITNTAALAKLSPDFTALLKSYEGINGVLVTAPAVNDGYDFHYRYFWPWAGTNEDPVTGGVQTFLTKYWGEKLNKKEMRAFQSSARTGSMTVLLQGGKVLLTSNAVIIFEGNLCKQD